MAPVADVRLVQKDLEPRQMLRLVTAAREPVFEEIARCRRDLTQVPRDTRHCKLAAWQSHHRRLPRRLESGRYRDASLISILVLRSNRRIIQGHSEDRLTFEQPLALR